MKKFLCLILAIIMVLPLAACVAPGTPSDTTPSATTPESTPETPDKPAPPSNDKDLEIKLTVLSGTTGMGMAKLISEKKNGTAALNYNVSVISDATQVAPAIISGSTDIAAVPTNLASTLYKKTNGGVYVLALNTLGVLYLLENGNTVNNIADLKGKTVYVPGAGTNPEYILKYIIEQNGLTVGTENADVIFDYTYSSPDTLASAVVGGLASIALLPEPKVTAVKNQNKDIRTALDLTAEWEKKAEKGTLVQGCIIVRKEFADAHPNEIAKFLEEYKASVNFVNESPNEAATLIAEAGIIPQAPLALKALPNCNITYIDGAQMKTALSAFYNILFNMAPASIGGAIPDDGLYYVK